MATGFCAYEAIGYIYSRDRDGNKTDKVQRIIHTRGSVQYGADMYGSIMRQQQDLRLCDRVDFNTWGI